MRRNVIRLTEADLCEIIRESVERIIAEDGEGAGGGGATNAAGVLQGGGTNPNAGTYDVPFGGIYRRKGYSPKKNGKGNKGMDMSDGLKRHDGKCGSISIPKVRV